VTDKEFDLSQLPGCKKQIGCALFGFVENSIKLLRVAIDFNMFVITMGVRKILMIETQRHWT
jgi:hypothetical protein